MIIGKFELVDGSYIGAIDAIGGSLAVAIKPQERGPDYLVTAVDTGTELGAAWKRTSRDRRPYLSVKLDSPFLASPVNCALIGQDDDTYALVWTRNQRSVEQPAV